MKNLGILLAIVVAGVVAYKWAYPSVSVRYRMTTVAELDGKQSSGSNVMEVTYYKNVRLLGASADMQIGIRGEATSIDFGAGGYWPCSWRVASTPVLIQKISFHLRTA